MKISPGDVSFVWREFGISDSFVGAHCIKHPMDGSQGFWAIYNDQIAAGWEFHQMVVVKSKGSVPQNGLKLG